MLYLLLAAISSIMIVVIFKFFDNYAINHNQAIVFNYIICVVTGCITLGEIPFELEMLSAPWMPIMILLGFLFIGGFNIVSRTVQHFGMAIASVAQRMSLGLSVTFAIWYYQEPYTFYKITGILVALSAVVFINIPSKKESISEEEPKASKWPIVYPISIFFVSAIIEILLQYLHAVHKMKPPIESIVLFASSGIVGFLGLFFFREKIQLKNIIAGIILGIPNYFSIYFMLKALDLMDGSTVYSLCNITIVTGAALVGFFAFKERLSLLNGVGILLAILAIFLITL